MLPVPAVFMLLGLFSASVWAEPTALPAVTTPPVATAAPADAPNVAADTARLRTELKKMAPDVVANSIQPTPVAGLYEVLFGAELLYFSADGRYMFDGNLIDLVTRENLTERPKNLMRKDLMNSLADTDTVIFPAQGTPRHVVTVFTDIDCGYCRKLHSEIKQINELGISVRYAFFPRAGKDSGAYHEAVSVWCAADRLDAMTRAKKGEKIEVKTCANPVDKHMDLVAKLGLSGTPAIITQDGRLLPGYVPAQKLAEMLKKP